MVEALGHSVAAEARNMNEAVELARSAAFNLAIIDIHGSEAFTVGRLSGANSKNIAIHAC